MKSAVITTYTNKTLVANVFNKNELELLESSKTNLEDDTIIFTEAVEPDFDLRLGNSKSNMDYIQILLLMDTQDTIITIQKKRHI